MLCFFTKIKSLHTKACKVHISVYLFTITEILNIILQGTLCWHYYRIKLYTLSCGCAKYASSTTLCPVKVMLSPVILDIISVCPC